MKYRITVVVWLWCVGLVAAQAPIIFNGDFNQELSGWDASDTGSGGISNSPSSLISVTNGVAELHSPDGDVALTSLSQSFFIPPNASLLRFEFQFESTFTDGERNNESFRDHFQVTYRDMQNPASDRQLLAINEGGAYHPVTYLPESFTPGGGGWFLFEEDVSALAGHSGTLFFDLHDDWDQQASVARVDNVQITTTPTAPGDPTNLPVLAVWELNRQSGTYFGVIQFTNTQSSGVNIVSPFYLMCATTPDMRFMNPSGTTTNGYEYMDITPQVEAYLQDGQLNPGDMALVTNIEVYMRYRQDPPVSAFWVEAVEGN